MFSKKNQQTVRELINEQINDVKTCLINFEGFMRASTAPETVVETLRVLAAGVAQAENEADVSLRKMIDSLAETAYLPSTRQELISIATDCDRIANKCEHFAQMSIFQRFRFPAEFAEDVNKILAVTDEQFELLQNSVSALFSDFGALAKDHRILDDIRTHESAVDRIEQKLYDSIFDMDITLAEKMQLFQFVEWLADLSDIIENIADKIQIMLITRKA